MLSISIKVNLIQMTFVNKYDLKSVALFTVYVGRGRIFFLCE